MDNEDKQKNYDRARQLFAEQNFSAAVIAGGIATLLAAAAYGITVSLWPVSYGFAAAGVGIFIGAATGFLGRGIATKFAVAAALYTIAGLLLGNLFRTVIEMARVASTSPFDVLDEHSFSMLAEQAMSYLSIGDLIYWFVAVVAAAFLSRRSLSRADRLAVGLFEIRDQE